MAVSTESNRLFLRGETAVFTVHFFADAAQTTPLIPLDAALYPAYTIYDIDNQVIQSGVGTPEVTPGRFKVNFIVPIDALLSNDNQRWRIEWTMVATDSRQIDLVEEFDVLDTVITASESRDQKVISLIGKDYRAVLRLCSEPAEVSLDVFLATSTIKIVDGAVEGTGGISKSVDGDSIVYFFDIPASGIATNCFLQIIWSLRNTAFEPENCVYQSLTIVTPATLNLVTCVRMLIDKFQKRLGVVQAYEDSDIVEYLLRGQELVNSVYPTTFYGFGNLPSTLTVYHILFSSWYGLQAQRLLEVDLGINFSGQTVTLDYDHASGIADVASTWSEFIATNLPAAKLAIVRRTTPVGTVAGRGYRYSDINLFTFKIASIQGGTNNLVSQLTTLGLLF